MLGCLENELESTKADAEIIVEEFEKCTNKKISFEKTIADMKMKFGRYREIIYLMKDSLSGLAAMHEDTSDKLIDVVMKTAHASRVVVKNAKKQFHGLENEISSLNQDPILVDEMVHNNNVVNVKKEPEDGLGEESSSNTAKLVAQDFSWEFNLHFGERAEGRSSDQQTGRSEDESGRCASRLAKKRKFTE